MKRPHYRGNRPERRSSESQTNNEANPAEQAGEASPGTEKSERRRQPDTQKLQPVSGEADRKNGAEKPRDRRDDRDRGQRRRPRGRFRGRQQKQDQQRDEPIASDAPTLALTGILDLRKDNTAIIRRVVQDENGEDTGDVFIPAALRPHDYRPGVSITVEAARGGKAAYTARKITVIDGAPPEEAKNVPPFERGTVVDPYEWFRLETGKEPIGTRVIDLFCPVGKGTRGMIVAPPRSGKTVLLKQIAQALVKNHPEVKLMIVLVDERPEEVTDFRRSVPEAEVWASSNDETVQSHLDMARLVINRAKRIVEKGGHVVLLLDSITRLARAFNAAGEGAKGRTMSGGMAAGAMQEPRAIFGASRCFEDAGSLTILATALVETGSQMDELIFQEFKGTGNMELVLDRKLAEKRLFPAIDVSASGTRKDEKLQDSSTHKRVGIIRRYLSGMDMVTGMTRILEVMEKTESNELLMKKFEP